MLSESELLSAIDDLGPTEFSGLAFRHTAPRRDPLSGEGARRFGGRWNAREGSATIYLARPVESCIAEFLRMAEGQGRGAASFLPRDLHVVELNSVGLIDLRSVDAMAAVSLAAADLVDESWAACQVVGEATEVLGYAGLLALSAAGVGEVIAMFERRLDPGRVSVVETRELGDFL